MLVKRYDKTRKCWVYDVRLRNELGKTQYYPFGHTSKTLAKEYQEKLRNQIREWRAFPEKKLRSATFDQFVKNEYLPKHARGKRSERDFKSICGKLCREPWADKNIQSVGRYDVEPYLTRRYNEKSIAMANREFCILKGIFTKAEQWGYRPPRTNPCFGVKMLKEMPRTRIFSQRETDNLLNACMPIPEKTYSTKRILELQDIQDKIQITLETGARKDELLRVRCEDINLETNMIRFSGKGGKERFVPLNEKAREIFARRMKTRTRGRNSYIFGNGKVAPKDFKRAFKSVCKNAGIDEGRIHDLRRTFGTRCALAGAPPKTLQKWMGHENIETTMKYYVQIPEAFEREAIERLQNFGKDDRQGDSSPEKGGND